jgi:hypothetical protein
MCARITSEDKQEFKTRLQEFQLPIVVISKQEYLQRGI